MPHDSVTPPLSGAASRSPARQRLGFSFSGGLVAGVIFDLAVIAVLWFLKLRDTSVNPWETLTIGSFVAGGCIVPTQFVVCGVLALIRRTRPLAGGLVVATALGLIALLVLLFWSNWMAVKYGEAHHLAQARA